jgi:hypothetical protein
VTYNSDGRVQFQENWSVPPGTTPLRIRDVRVASSGNVSSGTGGSGVSNDTSSPIPESQVTRLIADVGARPIKGPALAAGRTAIVDPSGLIESAVGNATDCMHVDGSSGPAAAVRRHSWMAIFPLAS